MKKRQPLILLEMMIAMTLMGCVIAVLMSGFYSAIKAKKNFKMKREQVLSDQRLKLRFALLFQTILDVKPLPDGNYYIRYKGGVDRNPGFRGEVEGFLQIKNNILSLTSWSAEGNSRHEILAEHVKSIQLKFFDEERREFLSNFPKHKPRLMQLFLDTKEFPLFL